MKKKMNAIEVIKLANELMFQLGYNVVGQKPDGNYLRDIPHFKLQYAMEKNLDILQKEVSLIEKTIKQEKLKAKYKELIAESTKDIKDAKKKQEVTNELNLQFQQERYKEIEKVPEIEIDFYLIDFEISDDLKIDRSGFWCLKHFIK